MSFFVNPFYSFAIFPYTSSWRHIKACSISAFTILFVLLPLADVLSTVFVRKGSIPMSLIIYVITFIDSSIRPDLLALSVHVVVQPLSCIFLTIMPLVHPVASNLVLQPVAGVLTAIAPSIRSFSMLHAFNVVSLVFGAISPFFEAVALLDVIFELPNICASIRVSICSLPISHVVLELSGIYITLSMPEGSSAFCFVVDPVSFIVSTIHPVLYSIAVAEVINISLVECLVEVLQMLVNAILAVIAAYLLSEIRYQMSVLACFLHHLTSVARIIWKDEHIEIG